MSPTRAPTPPQACVLRERVSARSWAEAREALRARRAALEAPQGAVTLLYSALLSRGLARFGRARDPNPNPNPNPDPHPNPNPNPDPNPKP